jgi:hypothetical protein
LRDASNDSEYGTAGGTWYERDITLLEGWNGRGAENCIMSSFIICTLSQNIIKLDQIYVDIVHMVGKCIQSSVRQTSRKQSTKKIEP